MEFAAPEIRELGEDPAALEALIRQTPNGPAVFLLHPRQGPPYLARTSLLQRRLRRLLGERARPSRLLNLRGVAVRLEYWPVASKLETWLLSYHLARRHFPEQYLSMLRLRLPCYVKLILSNAFPRSQVTTRLSGAHALHYGPFRSRASAELFEGQVLELFQVRRCQEDLEPHPEHPGCIYGEMNRCLRPCQQAVTREEYGSEVERLAQFLRTGGRSLVESAAAARDRLSEELNFEEAARQHKRLERVQQVLKLRDDLACDAGRLNGAAITVSIEQGSVELWFCLAGGWLGPHRFPLAAQGAEIISMDRRLKELSTLLQPARLTVRERQEHLAILARWYYSSWRDGEWVPFDDPASLPYRKLVNAIHRVAAC